LAFGDVTGFVVCVRDFGALVSRNTVHVVLLQQYGYKRVVTNYVTYRKQPDYETSDAVVECVPN
jgi:hypothetical protein